MAKNGLITGKFTVYCTIARKLKNILQFSVEILHQQEGVTLAREINR